MAAGAVLFATVLYANTSSGSGPVLTYLLHFISNCERACVRACVYMVMLVSVCVCVYMEHDRAQKLWIYIEITCPNYS